MSILDDLVEKTNAVKAILLVNLESETVDYHSSQLQSSNPKLYEFLRKNRFSFDPLANFKHLKQAKEVISEFSKYTICGDLKLTILYFTKNILVVDLTEVGEEPFAIVYTAEKESDIDSLIHNLEENKNKIKNALEEKPLSQSRKLNL